LLPRIWIRQRSLCRLCEAWMDLQCPKFKNLRGLDDTSTERHLNLSLNRVLLSIILKIDPTRHWLPIPILKHTPRNQRLSQHLQIPSGLLCQTSSNAKACSDTADYNIVE
jgi:hypothetical protein